MKKQLPNLTEQEKINFLAELKELHDEGGWFKSANPNKDIKIVSIVSGILTPIYICFLLALPNIAITSSFLYGTFMLCSWTTLFTVRGHENRHLLNASNGKIDRKTYYELVKSNEIENWKTQLSDKVQKKYLEKKQIQVEEYLSKSIDDAIIDIKIQNPNISSKEIEDIIKKSINNNSNNLEK